ncbi:MAG TPA: GTP cyclohydrolase I FolE [Anaeromyxobacteraceae bacterium]|nr:GTP cyclohydrolase I FolE [Anaeromyxobacteraceae bacterium]
MAAARARGRDAAALAVARFLDELLPPAARRSPDLRDTPARVADAFRRDLLDGYRRDPARLLSGGMPHRGRDLVVVTDIDFHSVCPHHLLPYRGVAHVAYVPGGRVVGFGALVQLLDCFAHRLVIEEALAREVAEALVRHLGARGAACSLHAEQLCLTVRGERRRSARAHAQAFAGAMEDDRRLQGRVLALFASASRGGARRGREKRP